jgi:hypothetical protein
MSIDQLRKILLRNLATNNTNLSTRLNDNEIAYLNELLNENPNVFYKISSALTDVIEYRRIVLHDFPLIILLISNIYNSVVLEKLLKNVDIINIVQYTIDSILDAELLPLSHLDIDEIEETVDASVSLLRMNIAVIQKDETWCFSLVEALIGYFCKPKK